MVSVQELMCELGCVSCSPGPWTKRGHRCWYWVWMELVRPVCSTAGPLAAWSRTCSRRGASTPFPSTEGTCTSSSWKVSQKSHVNRIVENKRAIFISWLCFLCQLGVKRNCGHTGRSTCPRHLCWCLWWTPPAHSSSPSQRHICMSSWPLTPTFL